RDHPDIGRTPDAPDAPGAPAVPAASVAPTPAADGGPGHVPVRAQQPPPPAPEPAPAENPPVSAGATGTPIAVIDMAGRFPGADDLTALWGVVAAGEDRIGPVPADRHDLLADPRMKDVRAGFLDRVAEFDATAF